MNKKKIAFFINTLEVGGAEKVLTLLISHFNKEYEIHLVLLNNLVHFPLPVDNIRVKIIDRYSSASKVGKAINILKIPLVALRLKKYLQKNDIGLCFSFLNRPNFINCFLKILRWKGRVLIGARIHTSSEYAGNSIAGKTGLFLVRVLYKYADIIIPNSFGIEKDLKENFKLKNEFSVIYNPIDIKKQQLEMMAPVDDVQFDKFTFIHVGRFEKRKNQAMLLKAVKRIKEKDFQVLIIGYGSMEKEIKENIITAGINDKIIFLGYRNNNDIAKYIAKSNCQVMTSDFEGFPNVLLEGLVCNTPIISTDCDTGPREILTENFNLDIKCSGIEKGKFGLLIPVNDNESLASAMELMMSNKMLHDSFVNNSTNRALDFDLPVILNQYAAIFDNI